MEAATAERSEHGVRKDAIGFLDGLIIGIASTALLLGMVLMFVWRLGGHREFFGRKLETVQPDVAAGRRAGVAAVPDEAV
jgi:hypothetical protein